MSSFIMSNILFGSHPACNLTWCQSGMTKCWTMVETMSIRSLFLSSDWIWSLEIPQAELMFVVEGGSAEAASPDEDVSTTIVRMLYR